MFSYEDLSKEELEELDDYLRMIDMLMPAPEEQEDEEYIASLRSTEAHSNRDEARMDNNDISMSK